MLTYEYGIIIYKKNFPPSYGLPVGPIIDACQCDNWLSNGTASMPSVASTSSALISPRSRLARNKFTVPDRKGVFIAI